MAFKKVVGAAFFAATLAAPASSAVVVSIQDLGSDVVASYSGTINLSGNQGEILQGGMFGNLSYSNQDTNNLWALSGLFSQWNFATFNQAAWGGSIFSTNGTVSGDAFGFQNENGSVSGVYTPRNYTGGSITGSLTLANTDIASLGLSVGKYSYFLPNDKIVLHIGKLDKSPATVPLPASALLLLGGLGGFAIFRRRKDI